MIVLLIIMGIAGLLWTIQGMTEDTGVIIFGKKLEIA